MNEPSPRAVKAAEGIQQMFTPGYTMPPVEEAMAQIIERETGIGAAVNLIERLLNLSEWGRNSTAHKRETEEEARAFLDRQ